jgi:hypothetical protein
VPTVSRFLVLGEPKFRETLTRHLEAIADAEVVECDPALGDCVMYVRLEGERYDAFFFVGFDHPVTRGALAIVAERAVLIPLLEDGAPTPDAAHDGYLFRLPQALAFRDPAERDAVLRAVPQASAVPNVLIERSTLDRQALASLIEHATATAWHWDAFVEGVRQDSERAR